MDPSNGEVERYGGKDTEHLFDKPLPSGSVQGARSVDTMEQLGGSDGRDPALLVAEDGRVKARPLRVDQD